MPPLLSVKDMVKSDLQSDGGAVTMRLVRPEHVWLRCDGWTCWVSKGVLMCV